MKERVDGHGRCGTCGFEFPYMLIHNGFNESCYAYCEDCGCTAILDTGYEDRPGLPRHRSIEEKGEILIAPCPCGGRFRAGASPRCPSCHVPLSASEAAQFLEVHAARGWKWQGNWTGLYCIVINGTKVNNPWRTGDSRLTTA